MAVTAPTDLTPWVPSIISAKVYDTVLESDLALTSFSETYDDLSGKAGEAFTIPTVGGVTPADNLAVTTAAVDDKLSGAGVTVTIKEAVKSIAFYDRTVNATGVDINALAGQKVGAALAERIELDLGAAAYAGRNVTADTALATGLSLAALRTLIGKVPAKLRRRGMTLFAEADALFALLSDATVMNAAAFGSDEAIRNGAFSRPILGVNIVAVDDGTFPLNATKKVAALVTKGALIKAFQKAPSNEQERDARARLTRVVGTSLHAEGVVDSRGVVFGTLN